MKFNLQLRVTTDDGSVLEHDLVTFARTEPRLETLGLTLEEGKKVLKTVQQSMVETQVLAFLKQQRPCPDCRQQRRVKGSRRVSFSTVFGDLKLRSPRLHHCDCNTHQVGSFSPLSELLTEKCHPELVHLETRWACLMSYGLTAKLIKDVLPVNEKLNAVGIRKHVLAVADRLEEALVEPIPEHRPVPPEPIERTPATSPQVLTIPDGPMTVGIDGGYVRTQRKQGFFEVIAGKSLVAFKRDAPEDQDSSSAKCFGFVQTFDQNHKQRFLEHLNAHGLTAGQKLEFFSDGGETVRGLHKHLSPDAQHVLDWFHISMRLTVLGQYAKSLLDTASLEKARGQWQKTNPDWQDWDTPDPLPGCAREEVLVDLESVKHYLWHGNAFRALEMTNGLLLEVEMPNPPEKTRKLLKGLLEFRTYIERNQNLIVNYGERYRMGDRISTAFVESTVNQVIAKRFCKKQSMQWSVAGSHRLLQVRTRVLNGDLETAFKQWYPAFGVGEMQLPELLERREIHPRN